MSILLAVTVVSFIALVIQTLFDIDDVEGFGYFTIRSFLAFLLGFCGMTYILLSNGLGSLISTVAGLACGISLMLTIFYMTYLVSRLQQLNGISSSDYIGIPGTVTLKILKLGSGTGKVECTINGRLMEIPAITEESEDILKGTHVRVIKKIGDKLLVGKKVF